MADETTQANTHITDLRGRFRTGTSDPTNPVAGDMYFNTTTNYLAYYDGSQWRYRLFTFA